MTQPAVRSFLANFDKTPTTRKQVAKVLRLIMNEAVALGWRSDNPVHGIRIRLPKPERANIWEQADVDLYAASARLLGMSNLAAIILLEWEIGQRLNDVERLRVGHDYDRHRGVFSFAQSKTGAAVTISVSPPLRDLLASLPRAEGDVLFQDEATGKAYRPHHLSRVFRRVRNLAVSSGGRALVLRHLRHSCVVQLARAGCTVPEIASITGHTFGSVNTILAVYLPRDGQVARNAQMKRGLVSGDDGDAAEVNEPQPITPSLGSLSPRTRRLSIMRKLGPYVSMRQRNDGTHYVYFFVPLPLRPKGWGKTIPLPMDAPRTGDLSDKDEFARIQVDAARLHRSLTIERLAQARQAEDVERRRAKPKGPGA